jgi:hypothetical protein
VLERIIVSEEEDKWVCSPDSGGSFPVKRVLVSENILSPLEEGLFKYLWKVWLRQRLAFLWKILHDRIPIRSNLAILQVITVETASHLLCTEI